MAIKLKVGDSNTFTPWRSLLALKLKVGDANTFTPWRNISSAFVKTDAGWRRIFGTPVAGPVIDQQVAISAGNWYNSSGYTEFELSGLNGTWTYSGGGTISQTYIFQYSADQNNWTTLSTGSITNDQIVYYDVSSSIFSSNSL